MFNIIEEAVQNRNTNDNTAHCWGGGRQIQALAKVLAFPK
jgi:hypothetical protein